MKSAFSLSSIVAACALAANASATLSQSEIVTVRELVAAARPDAAAKVRAIVARPDLTLEESEGAMESALEPVAFTDTRATFLRELLFGGASTPSRNVLAAAVTKGLISRADAVLSRHESDLEQDAAAQAELVKLYGFIDSEIANAHLSSSPPHAGHDPQAGISPATYDAAALLLSQHLTRHPKWLKADAQVSSDVAKVRAQATLATVDMVSDTPTRRIDAADRAGLVGARRSFYTELGVLVLDTGTAIDSRIDRVRAVLLRMAGARADVSAIAFGDEHPALRARGIVVGTKSDLATGAASSDLLTDEVDPATIDAPVAELARQLARIAVKRAIENRPDLKPAIDRDVASLLGDASKALGKPADLAPESVMAAAVSLLAMDAPRLVELAMARMVALHPEAAALLSDALGVLATFGTPGDGLTLPLGQGKPDGSTETVSATNVRLAQDGTVTSFVLGGVRWELSRGDSGVVVGAKRNGEPVTLGALPRARVPVTDGSTWTGGGLTLTRIAGAPRAGFSGPSRLRVTATTELDAASLPSPADDVVLEGTLRVDGDAVLLLRAVQGKAGFRGVGFQASSGSLTLTSIGDGASINLAPPVALPSDHVVVVRLALKGSRFDATIAGVNVKGTLPPQVLHGDVLFAVRRGASLDLSSLNLRAN